MFPFAATEQQMGTTRGRGRGEEERVEYGAYLLEDVVEDGVVAGGERVSMQSTLPRARPGNGKVEGNTRNTRNDEKRDTYAS